MTNQTKKVESQDDDFTSTKGSGNTWNPKQNADKISYAPENRVYDATVQPDHKTKDILIGYWVDQKDNVGEFGSTVVTIETKEGVRYDVWLDTVLGKELEKVPSMNILVKLEWLGTGLKKDKKEGQKLATFNKWFVGYKADDVRPGSTAVANTPAVSETPVAKDVPAATKQTLNVNDDNLNLPF